MKLPPAVPESMGILVCNYEIIEVEGREREEEREGEEGGRGVEGKEGEGEGEEELAAVTL